MISQMAFIATALTASAQTLLINGGDKQTLKASTSLGRANTSVTVPAGWTVAAEPSGNEKVMNGYIMSPTTDLAQSPTYVSVYEKTTVSSMTAEERLKKYQEAQKTHPEIKKLAIVDYGGAKWVLREQLQKNAQNTDVITWDLIGKHGTKEYLILGATPVADSGKYKSTIEAIFKSVKLK